MAAEAGGCMVLDETDSIIESVFDYFFGQYSIDKSIQENMTILIPNSASNFFSQRIFFSESLLEKYGLKTITIIFFDEDVYLPDCADELYVKKITCIDYDKFIAKNEVDFIVLDCPAIYMNSLKLKESWINKSLNLAIPIFGISCGADMAYLDSMYARVQGFVISDIKILEEEYPSKHEFISRFNSCIPNYKGFNKPGSCAWSLIGRCNINGELLRLVNSSEQYLSSLSMQLGSQSSPYERISKFGTEKNELLLLNHVPNIVYSEREGLIFDMFNKRVVTSGVELKKMPFYLHSQSSLLRKQLTLGNVFESYKEDVFDYIAKHYSAAPDFYLEDLDDCEDLNYYAEHNDSEYKMTPYENYFFESLLNNESVPLDGLDLNNLFYSDGSGVVSFLLANERDDMAIRASELGATIFHNDKQGYDSLDICINLSKESAFVKFLTPGNILKADQKYWGDIYLQSLKEGLDAISVAIKGKCELPKALEVKDCSF